MGKNITQYVHLRIW